jgi:hypothetical protein
MFRIIFLKIVLVFGMNQLLADEKFQFREYKDFILNNELQKPLAITNSDKKCSETLNGKSISFLFGFYSLHNLKVKSFIKDSNYFYKIEEKVSVGDLLLNILGWPLTISTRSINIKKCSNDIEDSFKILTQKEWEELVQENRKSIEEKVWKELEDEELDFPEDKKAN